MIKTETPEMAEWFVHAMTVHYFCFWDKAGRIFMDIERSYMLRSAAPHDPIWQDCHDLLMDGQEPTTEAEAVGALANQAELAREATDAMSRFHMKLLDCQKFQNALEGIAWRYHGRGWGQVAPRFWVFDPIHCELCEDN